MEKFKEIMLARNWCPSRIVGLASSVNTPLGYVGSLLPSYQSSSHGGCRPRKCLKWPSTVQAMTGVSREESDTKCPPAMVPEARLIDMWNSGGIPGVRLANNMHSEFVDIIDCTREPFTAISHVWSHGRGNFNMNELPSCQLRFLCELVQRLGGKDAILWIDVSIEEEAKRIAISKLRRVYSEASKVLVIDKDLMQVGSDQTMQLLGSKWRSNGTRQPRLQIPSLAWTLSTFLETEFVSFLGGSRTLSSGRLSEESLNITKDCLLLAPKFEIL